MIASLYGILLEKNTNSMIVDCNGVGYEVIIPLTTYQKLPDVGKRVFIFTYLKINEDSHTLYGFANACEKKIFQELIKLNKVGPKIALSVLGVYDYQEVLGIVNNKDTAALTRVPGIGKTTAEKMLVDLKTKFNNLVEAANSGKQQMRQISNSYKRIAQEKAQLAQQAAFLATHPNANPINSQAASPETDLASQASQAASSSPDLEQGSQQANLNQDAPSSESFFADNFDGEGELDIKAVSQEHDIQQKAIYALVNLGLKEIDADKIVKKVYTPDMDITKLIKAALDFYKGKSNKVK